MSYGVLVICVIVNGAACAFQVSRKKYGYATFHGLLCVTAPLMTMAAS